MHMYPYFLEPFHTLSHALISPIKSIHHHFTHLNMQTILFPRLHLAEIEDQVWCPEFLRTHSHRALARTWKTSTSKNGSPAKQASKILISNLGGLKQASEYTFVDSCAGAGGPTPIIEREANGLLEGSGEEVSSETMRGLLGAAC